MKNNNYSLKFQFLKFIDRSIGINFNCSKFTFGFDSQIWNFGEKFWFDKYNFSLGACHFNNF